MDKARKNFERRRSTLKKKAGELAALCDAEICIICFEPNGDLQVWPENPAKAESVIAKYREASKIGSKRKRKEKLNLSDLYEKKIKTLEKRVLEDESFGVDSDNGIGGFCLWDEALDSLSNQSLTGLSDCLEAKVQSLTTMIESLKGKQVVPSIAPNQFEVEHNYAPFEIPLPKDLPFAGYYNPIG